MKELISSLLKKSLVMLVKYFFLKLSVAINGKKLRVFSLFKIFIIFHLVLTRINLKNDFLLARLENKIGVKFFFLRYSLNAYCCNIPP